MTSILFAPVTIVLADNYDPEERDCWSDHRETVKIGWLFTGARIVWFGRCSEPEWEETLRQFREQGYDPPIEDRRRTALQSLTGSGIVGG